MRKKILHILPEPSVGGMELVAIKLANFIPEMNHSFCFLYKKNNKTSILDILTNKGFPSYVLDKKEGIDFSLAKKISSFCREECIDIIHCRNFSSTLYGCLSRIFNRKVKLIADIRGVEFATRRLKAVKLLTRANLINKVICVSDDIKNAILKSGVNKQLVDYIPNGVDLTLFGKNRSKKESLKEYGLSQTKIIIGTVGRLEKIKNYSLLIRAFSQLISRFDNIHLVIVGDGSQRPELEQMANEYFLDNSITFLGYQNNVPDVMNLFDIFVSSSLSEGMSNVIMEAMASKLAVVASDVGGTPELIDHGKTGLLFKSNCASELSVLLGNVITDFELRQKLGKNAFEKIISCYSLDITAKKYLNIYKCC